MTPSDLNQPEHKIRGETEQGIKSIAVFSIEGESASAVLRILGPARHLGWKVIHGFDKGVFHFEAVKQADVVVLQRDFCREVTAYTQIITVARSLHKPVILDLDDLFFELPEAHHCRVRGFYTDALLPIYLALIDADLVTVSTAPLRETLLPYNPNIRVISNYLEDALWKLKDPQPPAADPGKIVIGYMGTESHRPDLQTILPALLELEHKYPGRIAYRFWGMEPPAELATRSQVEWPSKLTTKYADFVEYFQSQSADIVISPLADNLFNACKSAIKYLEYTAIGIAGVYSRVAPYQDIIREGEDGLLASSAEEWVSALSALIESPELRARLITNAQANIAENWMLSKNVYKHREIYEQALAGYQGRTRSVPPHLDLIRNIAAQHYELQQRLLHEDSYSRGQLSDKDTLLHDLRQEKADLLNRIDALNDEVVAYANSPSWKITRPFRKNSWRCRRRPGAR